MDENMNQQQENNTYDESIELGNQEKEVNTGDFIKKSFSKRFNDIDKTNIYEIDNYAMRCSHREDFIAMLRLKIVKENTAILMNIVNNPLFPKDLMEKLKERIDNPAVIQLINDKLNPPKLKQHMLPSEEMSMNYPISSPPAGYEPIKEENKEEE